MGCDDFYGGERHHWFDKYGFSNMTETALACCGSCYQVFNVLKAGAEERVKWHSENCPFREAFYKGYESV